MMQFIKMVENVKRQYFGRMSAVAGVEGGWIWFRILFNGWLWYQR
jgi:hypothetical protein